jgi:proline iminopeptidase
MVNSPRHASVLLLLGLGLVGCLEAGVGTPLVPPTAERDQALPRLQLQVAGHTRAIHLETFGEPERPVLLVLHGSLADYRALRFLSVLADRYFVVMWDQRGNGLSERVTAEELTDEAIFEEIDRIKEHFSPGRPVTLIGHSFGAMYSALYMSRRPEAVRQAVLMEPAGLNTRIFEESFPRLFRLDLFDPGLNQTFWQSEVLSASDHETMDYKALLSLANGRLLAYFCDPDNPPRLPVWRPGAYAELVRNERFRPGGGNAFDHAAGLESFPAKVLLLGSECSALGYDFQVRYHQPLFREAEVVHIPQAGHRLIVEQPEAVLAAIRNYLMEY